MSWTLHEAAAFCSEVEALCPALGWHCSLTGGTLYKVGSRKDVDVMFYRIRQQLLDQEQLRVAAAELLAELAKCLDLTLGRSLGWVHKATANSTGKDIDFFFPEFDDYGDGYNDLA